MAAVSSPPAASQELWGCQRDRLLRDIDLAWRLCRLDKRHRQRLGVPRGSRSLHRLPYGVHDPLRRPTVLQGHGRVLGCVGFGGSNYWSAIERGTPSLQVLRKVAVNVKDDDAIATDASEDTNSFEVRVALDRERYVGRSELEVRRMASKGFLPVAGLPESIRVPLHRWGRRPEPFRKALTN